MSGLSTTDWHSRFETQAGWTQEVRAEIFQSHHVQATDRILEVGCGTGALLSSLASTFPARYAGLDINLSRLHFACSHLPDVSFASADGARLPFPAGLFKAAVCHYLLLWVHDPLAVLKEMARVTAPGGFVAAMAEPDYSGRIDHPTTMVELGRRQRHALADQGADPDLGCRLPGLFADAGLVNVSVGILGARWQAKCLGEDFDQEWMVLEEDLSTTLPPKEMDKLKAADLKARRSGERVLFVPTFFAVGEVQ